MEQKETRVLIRTFFYEIGGFEQACINARDLHGFLEVGKDFSNWIKKRIDECGYRENQDFIIFRQNGRKINPESNQDVRIFCQNGQKINGGSKGRGRPSKEYIITLDMAKELCMIERNPKGRIARRYFIMKEKEARIGEKVQRALIALNSTALPYDTTTRALFFRSYGLTQKETARALGISRDRVQTIERKLREAGISIPSINAVRRGRVYRQELPRLLSRLAWKAAGLDRPALPEGRREVLPCCL